jgi:hypothetical protein
MDLNDMFSIHQLSVKKILTLLENHSLKVDSHDVITSIDCQSRNDTGYDYFDNHDKIRRRILLLDDPSLRVWICVSPNNRIKSGSCCVRCNQWNLWILILSTIDEFMQYVNVLDTPLLDDDPEVFGQLHDLVDDYTPQNKDHYE